MTSYVRHWVLYAKNLFQNIPFTIFSNFNYGQLVLKTKLEGLKRQWRSQIIGHIVCKKDFFRICLFLCSKTSTIIYLSWEPSKGLKQQLKWQLSSRITKNDLTRVSKWRHMSYTGHGMHKKNSEHSSYHIQQLQLWSTCRENQVWGLKTAIK